ncbi:MAG TPA: hypothetical protein VFG79_08745, partial [Solirubrobacter sp.]|nr:hypothetical protein [Solirubrobacter sp.]
LVRGVADEPVLGLAGALQGGQHAVERLGELADLVAGGREREALGRVEVDGARFTLVVKELSSPDRRTGRQ